MSFTFLSLFYGELYGLNISDTAKRADIDYNNGIQTTGLLGAAYDRYHYLTVPPPPYNSGVATGGFSISKLVALFPPDRVDLISIRLEIGAIVGALRTYETVDDDGNVRYSFWTHVTPRGFQVPPIILADLAPSLLKDDPVPDELAGIDTIYDNRPETSFTVIPAITWAAWITPPGTQKPGGASFSIFDLYGSLERAFDPSIMTSIRFRLPWIGYGVEKGVAGDRGTFSMTAKIIVSSYQVGVPVPTLEGTIVAEIGPAGIARVTQLVQGAASGSPETATPQTLTP